MLGTSPLQLVRCIDILIWSMNNNDETDRAKGEKKIILPANVEGGQIRNHAMKYRF
jgi:hypothetical protein